MTLAVDVGFGHVIQIDQRNVANTRARQRLGCPGANAANPQYTHVCFSKALERLLPIEPRNAAKATLAIDRVVLDVLTRLHG